MKIHVQVGKSMLLIEKYYGVRNLSVYLRVGPLTILPRLACYPLQMWVKDFRTKALCSECGYPYWHWWRHGDCIPF